MLPLQWRQAPQVLLGNLLSDTEGFTDQVFGATHLLGYRFAPRIRNIEKTKLFPIRKPSRYPNLPP